MHTVDNEESLPPWAAGLLAILRRRSPLLTWRIMRAAGLDTEFIGISSQERFAVRATLYIPAAELPLNIALSVYESAIAPPVGIAAYADYVLHEAVAKLAAEIVRPSLTSAS